MSREPDATFLQSLRDLLGPDGCLVGEDASRYLTDFRGLYQGRTAMVARPKTTRDVAHVVGACAAAGVALVPHGGNTSYCGGATPDESGRELVLSLERMRNIRALDPVGGTLIAEAGCTLRAVRDAAASVGRRFALSLGSEGSCQIGGNVSTNAGGTAVLRHGMMRELVLGLEVVLPDGRVLDQLRTLRKDNTGYDVKQLFIGAEGTLGIVTAAALKIGPSSADAATALVALEDIAAAVELLGRLRDGFGDLVETFEFMPAIATALALKHVSGAALPFDAAHPAYVLLELPLPRALGGLKHALEEFLATELEAGRIRDALVAQSVAQAEAFWFLREHIPAAQSCEGASLKHDVSLPVAALARFVDIGATLAAARVPGARIVGYGHVGDGNLHYNLSPPPGTEKGSPAEAAFLAAGESLRRELHDRVAELGGSFSAEHGIGRLKVGELERYEDPVALDVMRRIKQALDPACLMNPGKVLRWGPMPSPAPPTVETTRLRLRPYAAGDVSPLARLLAHPQVCRPGDPIPQALEAARRAASGARRRPRQLEFAVVVRRTGRLIGACEIVFDRAGTATIGYLLGRRHWGHGYGTEIGRALVARAFEQPGCLEVRAEVADDNERSRRVLLNAGMQWSGRQPAPGRRRDATALVEVYTLSRPAPVRGRRS